MTESTTAPASVLDVDAVLFDLDGTLVDSTASIHRTWRDWGSRVGLGDDFVFTGHGRPAAEVVAELVPADRAHEATALVERLEVADAAHVEALPGALDLLASIPVGRRALVTSSTPALAAARIAGAGLPAFSVTVTAADVRVGKPDPEGYLAAAAALGVEPARCLVVEDAPAGVDAARRAGIPCLALLTTHPVDAIPADHHVRDLSRVSVEPGPRGLSVTILPE